MSKNKVAGYTKEQFLNSQRYADKRDILNVLLEDNKKYTPEQVEKIVNSFLKKEVK